MFYAGASRRGGARAQHADAFVKPHASSQFTLANRHSFFLKDSPNLAAVDQHRNPQLVDNLLPALVFVFGTQVAMMLTGLTSALCVYCCAGPASPRRRGFFLRSFKCWFRRAVPRAALRTALCVFWNSLLHGWVVVWLANRYYSRRAFCKGRTLKPFQAPPLRVRRGLFSSRDSCGSPSGAHKNAPRCLRHVVPRQRHQ